MYNQNNELIFKNLNPTLLYVTKKKRYETGTSHMHDHIELTYVLSGKGQYEINGSFYDVKENDLLFVNPGDTHTIIIPNADTPLDLVSIGFTDINISGLNMEENTLKFADITPVYACEEDFCATVRQIITQILEEKSKHLAGKYFYMQALLVQLLLTIIRHFYKPEPTTSALTEGKEYSLSTSGRQQMVEEICDYMKQHYSEKISLDGIAQNMYLSPIYISKIFKEITGDSPINYLISIRLKKSEQLLKNSTLTIKEIAAMVGYDNTYHFSNLFKKHYGLAPKEYRTQKADS